MEKWVLDCRDKFGPYGTVGFCIARRDGDTLFIEDFMLSCRVQGKFIERALFGYLVGERLSNGLARLRINFHQTDRNVPAKQVLEELGFRADPGGGVSIEVEAASWNCDFIEIGS